MENNKKNYLKVSQHYNKNQFVICDPKNHLIYFQSYDSLIAIYDTNKNILTVGRFWNYYKYLEFDPLFQNDYIATKSLTNFSGIVIYNVNYGLDDYVITAFVYNKDLNGDYNSKLTKNKIRYDNDGNAYFIKNKCKYYLNEFMRV